MQSWGVAEIYSAPQFSIIEYALWLSLYHTTSMCDSTITSQTNQVERRLICKRCCHPLRATARTLTFCSTSMTVGCLRPSPVQSALLEPPAVIPSLVFRTYLFLLPTGSGSTCTCLTPSTSMTIPRSFWQSALASGPFPGCPPSRICGRTIVSRLQIFQFSIPSMSLIPWNKSPEDTWLGGIPTTGVSTLLGTRSTPPTATCLPISISLNSRNRAVSIFICWSGWRTSPLSRPTYSRPPFPGKIQRMPSWWQIPKNQTRSCLLLNPAANSFV